jgi:two-component system phosphate regulon sensor histidine kinase PhoR
MASRLQENSIQLAHRTGEVQAILRHMSDGVLLVDSQLRVAMCNPAAARMLGFDPETAVGQDVLRLSGIYDLADALQRTSQLSSTTEVEFMTRHGEERIIQASVTPGGGQRPGQQWVVAVLRDVTHLRHLERVRQDFVASAGHELRTPVAAIRSLAEALAAGGLSDPETGPEFVRQIIDNTERLERLVDDMLELARVETVAHRELCPVHVKSVIEKAVERLRVQAESAGLRLVVSVGDDLWARGDGEDIETAIVNLLDNAIKYAADGGSVEIEAAADDGEVLIRVVDHGPGIPLAERQRIFERFYRLDKARSRQMGGTGLGLSIVKHAVEKMGSRVWIEDTPGGGATFVIALPTLD